MIIKKLMLSILLGMAFLFAPQYGFCVSGNPVLQVDPVTITDDNVMLTSSHFDKSVRMSSAADHVASLPSVGVSEDGARIRIIKIGAGKVTIDAADTDIIDDSGAGDTIYNDTAETYAICDLEYIHAITTWVTVSTGTWTTTD